jgi:hypothetical protein
MRRLARFAAAATVVGSLLLTAAWTVLALAQAEPTSSCVATGSSSPPFYNCTLFESLAGAQSELSDVVALPPATGAQPVPETMDVALFENPQLPATDRTNWSDVIVFTPPSGDPNAPNGTVQFLSNGCASGPSNQTDISCFPAAATQPPIEEIQSGTGYDSQDCTPFQALTSAGAPYAIGHACSDAALNEPGANIPEVPMSFMLPVAALGIFGAAGLKRRRKAVNKPSAD